MITTVTNERFGFQLIKRVKNSPYAWENTVEIKFKGRPANNMEKKQYRIQKGVNGGTDSVFIICSNLPTQVDIGDKIIYLGKEWMVNSCGYYVDNSKIVSPTLFNDEYIIQKCPKGINIG